MPVSVVTGANGQDGSYLVELLAARGDRVIGIDNQLSAGAFAPDRGYEYRRLDLSVPGALGSLLDETRPDYVFHFAAVHGSAGFSYEPVWRQALEVNTASVHEILEHARQREHGPAILYASSSKVFGDPLRGVVDENSPTRMTCLYSVTKLAAEGLIRHYRSRHGVKAGVLYFFNHESPRRRPGFLFPWLAGELAKCRRDPGHEFTVNTLDFYCDWGSAAEYMELAAELAEKAPGEDFIVASGKTWLGKDFVQTLWARSGLDSSRHIREKSAATRPPDFFQASLDKMRACLGHSPVRDALSVCEEMAGLAERDL